ncbi:putative Cell division cycle protein 123 [Blattamonas nauphoetae]|uniref:Cell division cycle protein 123 n=1 Tax=Blattamonas nauphoetae TaxID=2049346 RepID=A0ABQ9XT93_9EUKA|nr:putative Cell division cycle protein 123 [Blattamonas nauphoetae]
MRKIMSISASFADIIECQTPSWYPLLSAHAPPTMFIPITDQFIAFMEADGILLPDGYAAPTFHHHEIEDDRDFLDHRDPDFDDLPNTSEAHRREPVPNTFPDITHSIDELFREHDYLVPKLNWSASSSDIWVLNSRSMQCSCTAEVLLLLKSSDVYANDILDMMNVLSTLRGENDQLPNPTLCLQQWIDLDEQREFRCFVRHQQLVGVCQRYIDRVFAYLQNPAATHNILRTISSFFVNHVKSVFPLQDYVFDIHLSETFDTVQLIDFNPYDSNLTDSLLFSWEELQSPPNNLETPFKFIRAGDNIADFVASGKRASGMHRFPDEIQDVMNGEGLLEFVDRVSHDMNRHD